ncbi:hypothetical protein [Pelagicoccus mobilis]|uniref:GYF domain-containing protein n=1 Tax=Pelagicoccus mobilis TaxID=415221 RepID=A0A934RWP6_9BACT|nr:hypothetical protein [Pelagicoccus mobilis]MBK1876599.1 hypothetical protein [Pelagicoccus mobilis]
MREYYIRREGDEDASGPFDIDQISSLIEANKLDANAYYYDIETESWLLISSNQELMDTLFPKKRKLTLRTPEVEAEKKRQAEEEAAKVAAAAEAEKQAAEATGDSESDQPESEEGTSASDSEDSPETATTAKEEEPEPKKKKGKKKKGDEEEERKKLEVTKMLALAEGRADDPSGKSPREKQAAVAFIGLRLLALFFLSSILAMAYIEKDLLLTADAIAMAKSPFIIVAVFDAIVLVTLLLQVTEVYPLLRFRAAIGAGFLTLLFASSGDMIPLLSNLLLMAAIYFTSAIIKIRFLIGCGVAGLAGILGYVYAFFLS